VKSGQDREASTFLAEGDVEVLAYEQQGTAIDFLSQAVAWFNGQGVECRQVMSNNGSA